MKAEELMIGDWVDVYHELTDESGFYKPLRVTGIHYNDGICFGDSTIESPWNDLKEFEEGVRPIPLTPEILEKNGLENDPLGCYFDEDKQGELEISSTDEGVYWTINYNEYGILKLKYVHQLQHALRLCKIEKEIIL